MTLSLAAIVTFVVTTTSSSSSSSSPKVRTAARVAAFDGSSADVGAASVYVGDVERTVAFVKAVDDDRVLAAVGQTTADLTALLTPPPPPPVAVPGAGYSVPRSSGGHSDAWWHGVANCEQGGRNDPYFGYFSFMDGSQGGKPWDEQVAAGNAVLARSGSESPAWAPSCVAAGYAASPGG